MMKKIVICILFILVFKSYGFCDDATAIRGVWVPAPRFTKVLHTYQNVKNFVNLLDSLNFNAIFLVSYAETKTIYPSKVLGKYTGQKNIEHTSLLSKYTKDYNSPLISPTSDAIADLISLAHLRNIKVFFWYEYGFMGDVKPITNENLLLANNPDWLGIANDGSPAAYHNKDFYFNAYNPKVQKFIINLIKEGIKRYPEVDGIQGDDRLPAMPKNSGYDAYTLKKYQKEHQGNKPPQNFNDTTWVNWRLNLLNNFGIKFYNAAHAVKKDIIVSFAPNPYPWSKENLMQDWPTWIKNGACDLIAVQCYRYSADAYKRTVAEAQGYVKNANPNQLFAPGIILMEGNQIKLTSDLLKQQLAINRELGINSEIFFYNEALNNLQIQNVFKEAYPSKVNFPSIK